MATRQYTLIRKVRQDTASPFYSMSGFKSASTEGAFPGAPRLQIETLEATDREADALRGNPEVLSLVGAFPTLLVAPDGGPPVAADAAAKAWGLEEIGATASAYDGEGVVVAVLDTGIDAAHPAFAGMTLTQADFTQRGIPGPTARDDHGHGTHCAGTIFGRDVEATRIGVARGVRHGVIAKVLDGQGRGDSTMLFHAIEWAVRQGANVISMSLGFDFPGYVERLHQGEGYTVRQATSMALRDFTANLRTFDSIMQYLDKQTPYTGGTVVVAASGNESSHPDLRLSASLPAAADGVISVGAVSRSVVGLELAAFSNIDVQLMAPGKDVLSARAGGGLVTNSGTSMACPHVAGAAALWWQAVRKQGLPANAASVAAKLLASANPTRIVGFEKSLHGHGLARTP